MDVSSPDHAIDDALLSQRIHFITGEINSETIKYAMFWLLYAETSLAIGNPLTFVINSCGGSLYDAFGLIDMMRVSKHKIRTVGVGNIMSCAALILMTGARGYRMVSKNAGILSHQFSSGFEGKKHELDAHMKELDFCEKRLCQIIQECCSANMDHEKIKTTLLPPTDVWLQPQDLIDMGMADSILTTLTWNNKLRKPKRTYARR